MVRVAFVVLGPAVLVACGGDGDGGGTDKDGTPVPTSDPPYVEIWSHETGAQLTEGVPTTFGGTATDDGPLDELVATWSMDGVEECSGPLDDYDNSTCEWTAPTGFTGVLVRLDVADAGGATGSAEIFLNPFANDPPQLRVDEPRTPPWNSNVPVRFEGQTRDQRTSPGEMHVSWTSSLQGALPEVDGTLDPAGFFSGEALLMEGTHTLTASVTDPSNETTTVEVTIDVGPDL